MPTKKLIPEPLALPEDGEELVQLALEAFKAGKYASLRQAALEHNAPRETVRQRFNGTSTRRESHKSQQLLTLAEEDTLEIWCLQYHAWGFPPRIDILTQMAESILKRRDEEIVDSDTQILHPMTTPQLQPQTVGKNWYKRFLGRHPKLSLVYSRKLDHKRAQNNNPKIIQEFFDLYKAVITHYEITTDRTFNMDEKGFLLGLAKSAKVIIHASKKYRFVTQDGGRETITILEAVGASGFVPPPMLIYKGAHHQRGWHEDSHLVPGDWTFGTSPKGWTDSGLALIWLHQQKYRLSPMPPDASGGRDTQGGI